MLDRLKPWRDAWAQADATIAPVADSSLDVAHERDDGTTMRFDVSAHIAALTLEQQTRLTFIRKLYGLARQGR